MGAFSLDSSCMIAGVCVWHEHHAPVARSIERRFGRGATLTIAAHGLLEAYAVLTRLPAPYRLSGPDAWHLVAENFANRAAVVACDADGYVSMLSRLAASGVTGGRSYDALIATTLSGIDALELLTLNPRHFERFQTAISIIDPTQEH